VPPLPAKPAVFFLDKNYQPTTEDTGRTGITALTVAEVPSVLVSSEYSEYTGAEPVVRFFSRSTGETVALTFASGDSLFPYNCQVTRQNEAPFTTNAAFSAYNSTTETFSLTREDGAEPFEDIALNKEIFTAYQPTSEVSESQNIRMRNAVVAIALWAALEVLGVDSALAVSVPLAGTSTAVGRSLPEIAARAPTPEIVAAGVALVTAVPLTAENAPEAEPPSITGTTGPAGGVLIDKRENILGYAMEVMPYTANLRLNFAAASGLKPNFGGFTDWRLPTLDEWYVIYKLYLEDGKLEFTQISPVSTTDYSLWTGTTAEGNENYAARLLLWKKATGANFGENFTTAEKHEFFPATYIRKYPQE
jgi:hypothetical protein